MPLEAVADGIPVALINPGRTRHSTGASLSPGAALAALRKWVAGMLLVSLPEGFAMHFSTARSALFLALFVLALSVVAVPAMASDQTPDQAQAAAPGTALADCAPAVPTVQTAPAAASLPLCTTEPSSAAGQLFPAPIAQQGPPIRQHYCKCGCGVTCTTDADCGPGGSCVAFVTCC